MNNAINKLKHALGVQNDVPIIMIVVSVIGGTVKLQGDGKVLTIAGNWSIGTKLIVRSGVVQSVVTDSGVVVYE